jgi:hypothetical protein
MELDDVDPLYKLDCVLMYLFLKQEPSKAKIGEVTIGVYHLIKSHETEINQIIYKLIKDNYVRFEDTTVYTDTHLLRPTANLVRYYNITFEGVLFLKSGGYTVQKAIFISENKKLETLKSDQIKRDEFLKILTWWIAAGAIVASIYYLIEIYKEFHLFFHRHGHYWIWEIIPKRKI